MIQARRRRISDNSWSGLIAQGKARVVLPTTDTGYKSYGNGRLFLPAATNYCTNPSFELDTNADGSSDGWSASETLSGSVSYSRPAGRLSGYSQRQAYTSSSDSNKQAVLLIDTVNSTFAAGEPATFSFYAKGSSSGVTVGLLMDALTNAGAWLASCSAATITLTASWARYSVLYASLPATTGKVTGIIKVSGVDTGDAFDITVDDAQLEKSSVLTPYFDGTYPDCAWTGAANASTSTRAVSALMYPVTADAYNTSGTVAMRWAPLEPSPTGSVYKSMFSVGNNAGTDFSLVYVRVQSFPGWFVVKDSNISGIVSADTWAAGESISSVCRWSASTLDLVQGGSTVAQASNVRTIDNGTQLIIGSWIGTPGRESMSYIGPVAISPSRITDAETVLLDAGLTAGWGGMELFRFFKDRGYTGTLILPLEGDSRGYVVG